MSVVSLEKIASAIENSFLIRLICRIFVFSQFAVNILFSVHCGSIRQTASIITMSKDCLRTGDKALIHFRFIKHPEYMTSGQRMVFREVNSNSIFFQYHDTPRFIFVGKDESCRECRQDHNPLYTHSPQQQSEAEQAAKAGNESTRPRQITEQKRERGKSTRINRNLRFDV